MKFKKIDVNKKIFRWFCYIVIIFLPHIFDLAIYILSTDCNMLSDYFISKPYLLRFFTIASENIGNYVACFGLIWAVNSYFSQQDKIKKEKQEKEKEEYELRLKELEKYKDDFRPNFVLNSEGTELIVLMRKDILYIENVRFYSDENSEGIFYPSLRNNDKINLKETKNNYFITAETLVGEKIIFGSILKGVKVHKALKKGYPSIIPNKFHGDSKKIIEKIERNWISFNRAEINSESEKELYEKIDINFMYKTVEIREKMSLNPTNYMLEIINKTTVKELFERTLKNLLENSRDYSIKIKQEVINELIEILRENTDRILLNPTKIHEGSWEFINKITLRKNNFTENKEFSTLWVVEQYCYTLVSKQNLDDFISIFKELISHSTFKKEVEEKIEEYKTNILKCLED